MENKKTSVSKVKDETIKPKGKDNIGNLIKNKGVLKTLLTLSAPLFLLFMADAVFYLFDTWMIVQFVDGAELVKGVLLSYYKFFTSFVLLYIIGTSIYVSYNLGKNKSAQEISQIINTGAIFGFVTALACYSVMMMTTTSYLEMIRGISNSPISNELIMDSQHYMLWYGSAQIIAMTRNNYSRILRIDGHINFASLTSFIVYPIAIFFNWIFMGVMGLGMSGAGASFFLATIVATIIMFTFIFIKQRQNETIISFKRGTWKIHKAAAIGIIGFGLGTLAWNIGYNTNELLQSVILAYMSSNGQNFLPLFTAYQLMLAFVQNITVTITSVIAMIVGYMVGSGFKEETKKLMKISMFTIFISQFLMVTILVPLFGPMSHVFSFEYSMQFFTIWFTVIISMAIFSSQGFMGAFLVATGNGNKATKDNIIKFFVISIPLQLIFFFGLYLPLGSSNPMHYFGYMWLFAGLSPIYLTITYRKKYKELLN